jgi:hypothetical protein
MLMRKAVGGEKAFGPQTKIAALNKSGNERHRRAFRSDRNCIAEIATEDGESILRPIVATSGQVAASASQDLVDLRLVDHER